MADPRPAPQDGAHAPFVLVPATAGGPPTRRADLDRDDRVGRKYDHSPESWLTPQPLAVLLQVGCACGWRSDPFPTPPGTRLAEPLPATATFRLPVVLTAEGFHQLCDLEWLAHLAATPPAAPPSEAVGPSRPRAGALNADRLTDLRRAGARFADDSPVAAEDFVDAGVDPPFTWGELRALCATRGALLTATDAAAGHARELLDEHVPPATAGLAMEAIRAVLRARYALPPALGPGGTPSHLRDELGEAYQPTPEEEALWRRLLSDRGHAPPG